MKFGVSRVGLWWVLTFKSEVKLGERVLGSMRKIDGYRQRPTKFAKVCTKS